MEKRFFVNFLAILALSFGFISCGEDKNSSSEEHTTSQDKETTTSKEFEIATSEEVLSSEVVSTIPSTSEEVVTSETPTTIPSTSEQLVEVDLVNNDLKDYLYTLTVVNQQQDLSKLTKLKMEYSEYETIYDATQEQKQGGHMEGYFDLDKVEGKLDLTMFGKTSKTSCSYNAGAYVITVNGESNTLNISIEEARALFKDDLIYKACLFVAFYDFGSGLSSLYERYELLFKTLDQTYEIPNVDSLRAVKLKMDEMGNSILTMNSNILDIQDKELNEKFSLVCNESIEMKDYLFSSIEVVNDMYYKNANNEVTQGKRLEIHGTCSTTL